MSKTNTPRRSALSKVLTLAPMAAEALILAAFARVGMSFLIAIASRAHRINLEWTGVVGALPPDSMQYLAWIRDGADHFLMSDMFVLEPTGHVFFSPPLLISALAFRLGLPITLSFAMWVPIAIVLVAWGVTALVHRLINRPWARVAALAAALFYSFPAFRVVYEHVGRGLTGEMYTNLGFLKGDSWLPTLLWGYPIGVLAVGALCFGLLQGGRLMSAPGERVGFKKALPVCLIALTCSLLQPWQGTTLLGCLICGELGYVWLAKRGKTTDPTPVHVRWRLLAAITASGTAPLAYYATLGLVNASWRWNGQIANILSGVMRWWFVPLLVAPIAPFALIGLTRKIDDHLDLMVRAWPFIAVAQIIFISLTHIGNTPPHAIRGISIPLAILAVRGLLAIRNAPARTIAALAAIVAIVTPTWVSIYDEANITNSIVNTFTSSEFFFSKNESQVLDYLNRQPEPGGVVASTYALSSAIPGFTGRRTWYGHQSWTPNMAYRFVAQNIALVKQGRNTMKIPRESWALWTEARFIVSRCERRSSRQLVSELRTVTAKVKRIGCFSVITLKRLPTGPRPPIVGIYQISPTPGKTLVPESFSRSGIDASVLFGDGLVSFSPRKDPRLKNHQLN